MQLEITFKMLFTKLNYLYSWRRYWIYRLANTTSFKIQNIEKIKFKVRQTVFSDKKHIKDRKKLNKIVEAPMFFRSLCLSKVILLFFWVDYGPL